MEFLRSECESVGATIVYATHIFDGLEDWPTHLMYLANGRLQVIVDSALLSYCVICWTRQQSLHSFKVCLMVQEFAPATDFPELEQGQLLSLVERWLRAEKLERQKRNADKPEASPKTDKTALPEWNNGWAPGRLASSIKHASNAVMRM
jgi:CCR4-NOT complex subunit CAF16